MTVESVVAGGRYMVFTALAFLAGGCSSAASDGSTSPPPGMGAAGAGTGGLAGMGGIAGMGGAAPSTDPNNVEPTDCPQAPTLDPSQSARLSLRAPVEFGAAPLDLGSSVNAPSGSSYKLTFFAYYVGNFRLIDGAGVSHPATLVSASDQPLPYGLQLVNMDDAATEQLRLAVAPGNYQSLRFAVGVHQACNAIAQEQRGWPLTIETEMNWGWTMLHLRLEGFVSSSSSSSGFMYHVGFPQEYRTVEIASPLDLSQGSLEKTLPLAADQLLGASTPNVALDENQFLNNLVATTFSLR